MNSITHWLKYFSRTLFLVIIFSSLSSLKLSAQFTVELTVIDGTASTTCTDAFATPGQPTWGVAVDNQDPIFYSNDCPNLISFPNQDIVHYSTTVDCISDLSGGQLFVCLWAFDNDPGFFGDPCALNPDQSNKGCLEVICADFPIPLPGTEVTYTLDEFNAILAPNEVLESTGSVTFKIAVSEDIGNNNIATNDHICNAIELPVVTSGNNTEQYNNYCTTDFGDPITGFNITNSVWFKFTPSESRRVFINVDGGTPALSNDPIDPEVAVFYAPTDECDGALVEVISQNSPNAGNAEFLQLECLNPKLTYYILVDGSNADPTGFFSINLVERGYPDPIEKDTFICRGTVLDVGDRSYANTGVYLDTIVNGECAEILETSLVVVEPVTLELRVGSLARGEGEGGGAVNASAQFGTGDYDFQWSNGQTNQVANNLIGGEQYCVTLTDRNAGCSADTCFIMEFPIPISAEVTNDTLDCSNSDFGQIPIIITAGKPPYQYRLQGIDDPSVIVNGVITKNDSIFLIENIPVGTFNIFVNNEEGVQRFEAEVTAPEPISINLIEQINLDCAGGATGSLQVEASGGTGALDGSWSFDPDIFDAITALNTIVLNPSDPEPPDLINLPAAAYKLTIEDENGCRDSMTYTIMEPEAATLNFVNVQPVDCFGEANGQATITSNEPIASVLWSNGETTETVTNLTAEIHKVTLINDMGCESTDSIFIPQPSTALVANIEVMETIACGGDNNGVLADASFGGNGNYEYIWSNGATADFIDNLPAGMYDLIVRDEKGCVDDTTVTLLAPIPIDATIVSQDVTCPGGANSGTIIFNNPTGGTAPYRFSVNNQGFINNMEITNLRAGTYAVLMQDDKGCEKTFEEVIINNPPEVTVNLGADMDITIGQTVELKATANRLVTYEWFSTDSLSCLDCATVSARPFSNATYTVIVTDEATGCSAEDEIAVSVLKARKLFVPNTFSPNGDGINDQLNLFGGQEINRVLRFEIYSRDGARVYKKDNFTLSNGIGWDGEYNGQQLSTDVFIYFAEIEYIDKVTEIFRGDFTLIR